MLRVPFVITLLGLVLLAPMADASHSTPALGGNLAPTTNTWTNRTSGTQPPPSFWGGMVYDPVLDRVILFGGLDSTGAINDTWEYAHGAWAQVNTSVAPSPRRAAAMAYDPATRSIILFGGADTNTGMGDTWSYNASGWTQLSPATSPSARAGASMIFDPNLKELILFGGASSFCCSNAGLGDFWSFSHGTWAKLSAATLPSQRDTYDLTWDSSLQEAVLFGGWQPSGGCGSPLGDSWVYNGSWSQTSTPLGLTPRQGSGIAFGPVEHTVLFGGSSGTCGTATTFYHTTWTFTAHGWSRVHPTTYPSARTYSYMCYDGRDGYVLMFGGQVATGIMDDTWSYT
jgi:hypothetical protein